MENENQIPIEKDKKKKTNPPKTARNWFGTWNNPKATLQELYEQFKPTPKYVVGQMEKGKEGTTHLQFMCLFHNAIRFSKWKKYAKEIHIEITHNVPAARKYVTKKDTRIDGPWEFGHYGIDGMPKTTKEVAGADEEDL